MPISTRSKIESTTDHGSRLEIAVAELSRQLQSQTDEHVLKRFLDTALPTFEGLYRSNRKAFSNEIIDQLRAARACQGALPIFIDICEDIQDVRTKEEAQELMQSLHEISDKFSDFAVRARLEKEYRGLAQAMATLPSAGGDPLELERNRRIARLNSDAPACDQCGSPMVIRASKMNAWWGCSTFPKCYSRQWLSKKQKAYLNAD